VVLLAKNLSLAIEAGVSAAGAPRALVGIIIAGLVLAPEGFAALAAARANRVQTSLNLAIGSALATIGLTIPAVALVALALDLDLELGLSMRGTVLLALTLLVATITLSRGRTTMVQGVIHLVIFATFLFTTIVP
jgi:Ca2+:H+ antiporter